jgi:hypothetical protein
VRLRGVAHVEHAGDLSARVYKEHRGHGIEDVYRLARHKAGVGLREAHEALKEADCDTVPPVVHEACEVTLLAVICEHELLSRAGELRLEGRFCPRDVAFQAVHGPGFGWGRVRLRMGEFVFKFFSLGQAEHIARDLSISACMQRSRWLSRTFTWLRAAKPSTTHGRMV